jgi:Putative prokaryotic signal transducing protein
VNASSDNKETHRLAARYAGMADHELLRLANQSSTLTDEARDALLAEISRRGILAVGSDPPMAEKIERPLELVLARAFRDLPEALIAKSVLDSAEVECFLFDENYVRLDWFKSNFVRGIKLMVADEDVAESRELLDQDSPEAFEISTSETFIQPTCPVCQSMDVAFQELVSRVVLASIFVNLPLRLTRAAWICHTCGHEWQNDNEDLHNGDWLDWRLIRSLWFLNALFLNCFFIITLSVEVTGFLFDGRTDHLLPALTVLFLWFIPTLISAWLLAKYTPERRLTLAFVTGFLAGASCLFCPLVIGVLLAAAYSTIQFLASAILVALATGAFNGTLFVAFTWIFEFLVD